MENQFAAMERYRLGSLPDPAPLAAAYIPMQDSVNPNYTPPEALSRGTLFPGLDLPFMNVVDELELYLDTHAEDREAFELYQTMLAVKKEAMERYARRCAPLLQTDQLGMERYAWLDSPWPWEYRNKREG